MDPLSTNHPIALSVLLNEDIYVLKEEVQSLPPTVETPVQETIARAAESEVKEVKKVLDFQYLGGNNKFWLIIVKDGTHAFINDADKQFLLKILAAKKLELDDIAIINLNSYTELDFEALKDYFAMSRVLTFGFNPLLLNIKGISSNQAGVYQNVKVLGTWSLAQLQADVNKKATYWKELKSF